MLLKRDRKRRSAAWFCGLTSVTSTFAHHSADICSKGDPFAVFLLWAAAAASQRVPPNHTLKSCWFSDYNLQKKKKRLKHLFNYLAMAWFPNAADCSYGMKGIRSLWRGGADDWTTWRQERRAPAEELCPSSHTVLQSPSSELPAEPEPLIDACWYIIWCELLLSIKRFCLFNLQKINLMN